LAARGLRYTSAMHSTALSEAEQRRLARLWAETGRELEKQRHAELAAQSAAESQRAAYDMLQLGGMLPPDPKRESDSGLVEMQRLFARGHQGGKP
jgi:hypothetical protein